MLKATGYVAARRQATASSKNTGEVWEAYTIHTDVPRGLHDDAQSTGHGRHAISAAGNGLSPVIEANEDSMNKAPLLKVQIDGTAVQPGEIPVPQLLRLLGGLNKVLQQTGRVLQEDSKDKKRTPRPSGKDVALRLVSLTHASPNVILGFDLEQPTDSTHPTQPSDFGMDVLEKAIGGLAAVQGENLGKTLPAGYDAAVLSAWQETGRIFNRQGIANMEFILNRRSGPMTTSYTPEGFARIKRYARQPRTKPRTITGKMLMAEFNERGGKCRVHTKAGDRIPCTFSAEYRRAIIYNFLCQTHVTGEATEDAVSGKIKSLKIQSIERMAKDHEDYDEEDPSLMQGSSNYWTSPTGEELSIQQNTRPIENADEFFSRFTWPGDIDDGFEEAINELRHPSNKNK